MSESMAEMQVALEAYRQRDREAAVNGAVSQAIATAGVALLPGAVEQVAALLRPDVRVATSGDQSVFVGPALKPLGDHVRERLNSADYAHFRGAASPPVPGQAAPAGPGPDKLAEFQAAARGLSDGQALVLAAASGLYGRAAGVAHPDGDRPGSLPSMGLRRKG